MCIAENEGTPSPMFSITGLALKELEPHISKANGYLRDDEKIRVSLHNKPRTFVVRGPPRSLCGLVKNLRRLKASSRVDQIKVASSKRKPVFSAHFLPIEVPYHSEYLKGDSERLVAELGESCGSQRNW